MPLPIDNYQASLALTQLFALQGVYPSRDGGASHEVLAFMNGASVDASEAVFV